MVRHCIRKQEFPYKNCQNRSRAAARAAESEVYTYPTERTLSKCTQRCP